MKIKSILLLCAVAATGTVIFQNCSPLTFSKVQDPNTNSSSSIICEGVASSEDCDPDTSKVTSEIYALSADEQATYGNIGVDTYFDHGDRIAAKLLFDNIFIPTRHFSDGFPTSDDPVPSYLENTDGTKLTEYFALRMKTNLSLTANDGPGLYQLALLSDDGSRLIRLDTKETVVDNNSTHSTRMGCGQTVNLAAGQSIPVEIDYYQGPRDEIAMTFLWRKVTTVGVVTDPLCGVEGNDFYFGGDFTDFTTAHGFGQLLSRGWKVVPAANLSHLAN